MSKSALEQQFAVAWREGMGSAGQLAAVQNHLKDMQKIAFTYLEMETRHD